MNTLSRTTLGRGGIAGIPVVSVAMITRNHGRLLADALDSVLQQQVDFPYEIIIGDDASESEDLAVAEEYAARFPDVVHLLRHENQRGVHVNVARTLAACRGEFVALLEGDDAWSFSGKLTRQVEFLRENPEVAGCFHDALIRTDEAVRANHANLPKSNARRYSELSVYPRQFHPWDLLARNVIPTASLVYRNIDLTEDLERFRDIELSLSWLVELLIIRGSRFEYFDELWAIHNNHSRSLTKRRPLSEFTRSNLRILRGLASDRYYRHLKTHIGRCRVRELGYLFDQQLDLESSFRLMGTLVRFVVANTLQSLHEAISMLRRMVSRHSGDRGGTGRKRS